MARYSKPAVVGRPLIPACLRWLESAFMTIDPGLQHHGVAHSVVLGLGLLIRRRVDNVSPILEAEAATLLSLQRRCPPQKPIMLFCVVARRTTRTRCLTFASIPRISAVSACSTTRPILFRPSPISVSRCRWCRRIGLATCSIARKVLFIRECAVDVVVRGRISPLLPQHRGMASN
jgi:hypothetical protein